MENGLDERKKELIQKFEFFIKFFNEKDKFSGPSTYFHSRVLRMIRNNDDYAKLLHDDSFLEMIYATLTAWGMHHMGRRGPKLIEFGKFCESIRSQEDNLKKMHSYKLSLLNEGDLDNIKAVLSKLFDFLKVNGPKTKTTLVVNSKLLHHLLPDLVLPIDIEHTMKFYYGKKKGNKPPLKEEKDVFLKMFEISLEICKSWNFTEDSYKGKGHFCTSVPKMIDNAIMGYAINKWEK